MSADDGRGTLALSGASTWSEGVEVDQALVAEAGGSVVVIPTGAAYERPDHVIEAATAHFGALGTTVEAAMVLGRPDAERKDLADQIRRASFIYLCGGSPLHIRSVLKDSLVLDAIVAAWRDGAIVAGQGGGTVVLTDPMVDPRGGAFTVGLGLVRNVAAVPMPQVASESGSRRTISLLPSECALVEIPSDGGVIRSSDGAWRSIGSVAVYVDRVPAGIEALAGKGVW